MRVFKLLSGVLLILGTIYFFLEGQLFYYGKNDLPTYNFLPLKIKPEFRYEFEGGFVLWDEHGFAHIGKGVSYWGSDFVIDEIIKYGIKDEKLVAQVKGDNREVYFVETKRNENPQSKQKLEVVVWKESENPTFSDYHWIQLTDNEEQIKKLELWHNYIFLASVLVVILVIFKLGVAGCRLIM